MVGRSSSHDVDGQPSGRSLRSTSLLTAAARPSASSPLPLVEQGCPHLGRVRVHDPHTLEPPERWVYLLLWITITRLSMGRSEN